MAPCSGAAPCARLAATWPKSSGCTRPGTRGVGAALLAHLEAAAAGFGYAQAWLETRRVNTRAVAFYRQHGYADIPNYGKYAGRTDALCLGKRVSA